MPIKTGSNAKVEASRVYSVGPQDVAVIDKEVDELYHQGEMQWTKGPTQV